MRMDSITKEKVFLELVEVVAHAHEQNIIHRDIKPENVIITPAEFPNSWISGAGKGSLSAGHKRYVDRYAPIHGAGTDHRGQPSGE